MNENCQKLFEALKYEAIELHLRWTIYRQLYASSEEAINLLNTSGSNVFYLLQLLLLDDCALRLSKLTDPPSQGRFENLSVRNLIESVEGFDRDFPVARAKVLYGELSERCEKFRTLRNKRIAHADLAHSLKVADEPLPGISREDVERALEALQDVLNFVELHYRRSQTLYKELNRAQTTPELSAKLLLAHRVRPAILGNGAYQALIHATTRDILESTLIAIRRGALSSRWLRIRRESPAGAVSST
jgi:AbiU2